MNPSSPTTAATMASRQLSHDSSDNGMSLSQRRAEGGHDPGSHIRMIPWMNDGLPAPATAATTRHSSTERGRDGETSGSTNRPNSNQVRAKPQEGGVLMRQMANANGNGDDGRPRSPRHAARNARVEARTLRFVRILEGAGEGRTDGGDDCNAAWVNSVIGKASAA